MPFTGDNSATLVSMNLHLGDCVVSLGTSDTLLVALKQAEPTTESHLMAHPTDSSAYMGMLCYKVGHRNIQVKLFHLLIFSVHYSRMALLPDNTFETSTPMEAGTHSMTCSTKRHPRHATWASTTGCKKSFLLQRGSTDLIMASS